MDRHLGDKPLFAVYTEYFTFGGEEVEKSTFDYHDLDFYIVFFRL